MATNSIRTLRQRVKVLSDLVGIPLWLQAWSPGDGHTRYSICTEADQPLTDRVYRLHEMAAFLDGAILAASPRRFSAIGREEETTEGNQA